MLKLFSDQVHFGGKAGVCRLLYPPIQQVAHLAAAVRGVRVPRHQEIGQFLAGTIHQKISRALPFCIGIFLGPTHGQFSLGLIPSTAPP